MPVVPSDRCIDLIKKFEGCELTVYRCQAGVLSIGYGTTGDFVKPGLKITQDVAEDLLEQDLQAFSKSVNNLVHGLLTQNQFDALVSFVYNVGQKAFKESTLLRLLNEGLDDKASEQFLRWNKIKGVPSTGLTRRRKAEKALFDGVV